MKKALMIAGIIAAISTTVFAYSELPSKYEYVTTSQSNRGIPYNYSPDEIAGLKIIWKKWLYSKNSGKYKN